VGGFANNFFYFVSPFFGECSVALCGGFVLVWRRLLSLFNEGALSPELAARGQPRALAPWHRGRVCVFARLRKWLAVPTGEGTQNSERIMSQKAKRQSHMEPLGWGLSLWASAGCHVRTCLLTAKVSIQANRS
jgi:hypothetical protein